VEKALEVFAAIHLDEMTWRGLLLLA